MSDQPKQMRFALHWRILIGLVLGAIVGGVVNAMFPPDSPGLRFVIEKITGPVGQIFLRLLIMTVVPLVFASLVLGVTRLGDIGKLGRMGAKTFAFFLFTMTAGVTIGLTLVNTIRPGDAVAPETRVRLEQQYGSEASERAAGAGFSLNKLLEDIVPSNPVAAAAEGKLLGVIFVALLTGIALTQMTRDRARPLIDVLETIGDVTVFIIGLAMRLAPIGVFALIFTTTAQYGFGVLKSLGLYVIVVLLGLGIQMFVTLPLLVRFLAKMRPLDFFRKIRAPILTAFSTSSSSATLPTSIRAAQEELKVPTPVAGFVLPLGATMNMNGTALFEGVTAVFLAQVFLPVDLTFGQQLLIVVLCVVTAVGAAGVPGGSIPLLAMVLTSVGVPPVSIALILGVDRILDMCRTTLNVVGDLAATAVIARLEAGSIPADTAPVADGRVMAET